VAADGTNVRTWTSNGLASQKFVLKTAASSITYESLDITLDEMIGYQQTNSYVTASYSTLEALLDPDTVLASYPLEFADLRKSGGLTGDQLESYIESTSSGRSGVFVGYGATFKAAADEYGINEVYFLSHSILESGWGTSTLANGVYYDGYGFTVGDTYTTVDSTGTLYPAGTYYNFFGIGAVDSNPTIGGFTRAIEEGWNSVSASIYGAAEWISTYYTYRSSYAQYTLYLMKWDYNRSNITKSLGTHQYATGVTWARSIATLMSNCYENAGVDAVASYIIPDYAS
jgi:beta-N-acetylglucosaminidase